MRKKVYQVRNNMLHIIDLEGFTAERKIDPKIQQMPKVELHVHLGGCFSLVDLWVLAQKYCQGITKGQFDRIFKIDNFNQFSNAWKFKNSLIRTYDDFSFLMDGVVEYLKKENIIYWEPAVALFEYAPLDPAKILDIAAQKLDASGISYTFIMDLIRGDGAEQIKNQYDFYHQHSKDYAIRGVGLAGNEEKHGLSRELIPIFEKAKMDGYGITIHAAEHGGYDHIKMAVEEFGANRIGHANFLNLCCDRSLIERIESDEIHLEFIPSALATWSDMGEDPLITKFKNSMSRELWEEYVPRKVSICENRGGKQVIMEINDYLRADVLNRMMGSDIPSSYCFSVNSDDPAMFGETLSSVLDSVGCTYGEHFYMMRMANDASFATAEVKSSIRKILVEQENNTPVRL